MHYQPCAAHDSAVKLCYAPRFISGTMLKSAANRLYWRYHDCLT